MIKRGSSAVFLVPAHRAWTPQDKAQLVLSCSKAITGLTVPLLEENEPVTSLLSAACESNLITATNPQLSELPTCLPIYSQAAAMGGDDGHVVTDALNKQPHHLLPGTCFYLCTSGELRNANTGPVPC